MLKFSNCMWNDTTVANLLTLFVVTDDLMQRIESNTSQLNRMDIYVGINI